MNSPNPFSGSTTISYLGKANSHELYQIEIYNIKGQNVRALECNVSDSGLSTVWDGKDHNGKKVSPGIYFYSLSVDGVEKEIRKLLLIR